MRGTGICEKSNTHKSNVSFLFSSSQSWKGRGGHRILISYFSRICYYWLTICWFWLIDFFLLIFLLMPWILVKDGFREEKPGEEREWKILIIGETTTGGLRWNETNFLVMKIQRRKIKDGKEINCSRNIMHKALWQVFVNINILLYSCFVTPP